MPEWGKGAAKESLTISSLRTSDESGYRWMADRMLELAAEQSGFPGVESVREVDGFGMAVSNSESDETIASWQSQAKNQVAQEACKALWKEHY